MAIYFSLWKTPQILSNPPPKTPPNSPSQKVIGKSIMLDFLAAGGRLKTSFSIHDDCYAWFITVSTFLVGRFLFNCFESRTMYRFVSFRFRFLVSLLLYSASFVRFLLWTPKGFLLGWYCHPQFSMYIGNLFTSALCFFPDTDASYLDRSGVRSQQTNCLFWTTSGNSVVHRLFHLCVKWVM
jgi:hypothetical protein